jgi:hypothetical protein
LIMKGTPHERPSLADGAARAGLGVRTAGPSRCPEGGRTADRRFRVEADTEDGYLLRQVTMGPPLGSWNRAAVCCVRRHAITG